MMSAARQSHNTIYTSNSGHSRCRNLEDSDEDTGDGHDVLDGDEAADKDKDDIDDNHMLLHMRVNATITLALLLVAVLMVAMTMSVVGPACL